jgi:hypothetical protein
MTVTLDENGLNIQTQQEITEERAQLLRDRFGVNIRTDSDSLMGQLNNIDGELLALVQQALLALYRSIDPAGAIGRALDARLTLTGSTRLGATFSVVDGVLTFSSAGTMSNGDLIENDGTKDQWQLTDGPHTAVGPFPEVIPAQFTTVETGPKIALAGTTWNPITIVAGLDGFTNPSDDAEPGRDLESDADARQRRIIELYSQGQGPLAAIQGVVSKVDGVVSVRVYHNPTVSPADADGIPFKAFNVVVETNPPTPTASIEQAIYDAIWSTMGAGGEAYGTDFTGTSTDTEGVAQPVAFDTVDVDDIVLELDLVTSTTEDAVSENLATVVAEEVLAQAQARFEGVGRDVLADDFVGIVFEMKKAGTISGVDAVNVRMSIDPAPAAAVAKLVIDIRSKADFDSANLTVAEV